MKILILNVGEDYSLGWSYFRAFSALGHECIYVDPGKLLGRSILWRSRITRRLFERSVIDRFNRGWLDDLVAIDADMIWVGKGAWAAPWLWEQYRARRPSTRLVCYNADDPVTSYSRGGNRPWVTESISQFDLFCTYKTDITDALYEHNARNVAVIPFAWDPDIHPSHLGEPIRHDLIFVGNGDTYREEWLDCLLREPWTKDCDIAIYGSWPKVRSGAVRRRLRGGGLTKAAMARAIASSKVSINILRRQNEGNHNMRNFETPGSGGVNASQYSEQQAAIFPEGSASYYFRSMDDVGAVLQEAVANDDRREAIRREASAIVANHTYRERALALLEQLP